MARVRPITAISSRKGAPPAKPAGEPDQSGAIEQVAIGTATVIVAGLGLLLVPQLDDVLFMAMLAAVGAMVGMGTYLLGRGQPGLHALGRAYAWTLWVPPVAWVVASAAVLRLARTADGLVPALAASAVLAGILFAQHRELQLSAESRRAAEFAVSLAVLVSGFALFGILYELRSVSPGIPALTGLAAAILATVPLRRAVADEQRTALYCVLVGTVVGQVAWGLVYWTALGIVGAAVLLLLFYVLVGISEAILDRSLSRRVLLEYSVVGACGLVLIVGIGPWRA